MIKKNNARNTIVIPALFYCFITSINDNKLFNQMIVNYILSKNDLRTLSTTKPVKFSYCYNVTNFGA